MRRESSAKGNAGEIMANSEAAPWKITQVGVVVKDVKKVAKRLEFLGIGPFQEMKLPTDRKELFRGKPALADANIVVAALGEIQLELVEPLAVESPHREFLETKGEGIQHFMVAVDDIEREIKRLTDKGCTVLLDIRMPGGIHGAYIDLHAGGIIVEMFQKRPDHS
jgi:methylmalonyl-CoA/ethylmalonyl-CoA epimerase